jgi:hypothetical protein
MAAAHVTQAYLEDFGFSSIAAVFSGTVAVGSTVSGAVSWRGAGVTLTSVTDNKGNTYAVDATTDGVDTNSHYAQFRCIGVTTGGTSFTVTATLSGASDNWGAILTHLATGVDATDGTASWVTRQNPGEATDAIIGNAITLLAGSYVVAFCFYDPTGMSSNPITVGSSPWLAGQSQARGGSEYQIVSGAGAVTPTFTESIGTFEDFIVAVQGFKASGGSGLSVSIGEPTIGSSSF